MPEFSNLRDVRERKAGAAAECRVPAAATCDQLEELLDYVAVGLSQLGPDGRWVLVNRHLCELLGYSRSELLGTSVWEITHPDDRAADRAQFERLMRGEIDAYSLEKRYLHRSGGVVWAIVTRTCKRDRHGRPELAVSAVQPIDERKRAEDALRREQSLLRRVLDATPNLVFVKDRAGRFVLANAALARCYGTELPDLLGRTDADFNAHPDEVTAFLQADRTVIDERRELHIAEEPVTQPDGRTRWYSTTKLPLLEDDGTCSHVLGVSTDITAQREAQQILRERELYARQMISSLPGLVWTTRPDGQCDFLSSQWVEYTGTEAEEQLGYAWLSAVHPDDRGLTYAAWQAAVAGRADYDLEFRIRRRDGVYRWFKVRGRPIRDEAGRITRWFGTCVDIDDLKRTQEALRLSEERIARTQSFALVMTLHVGLDGAWLRVPPTFCQMLGYAEHELLGRPFRDVTHPDDFWADWSQCQRLIAGEIRSFELEKRFVRKDGGIVWGYINCSVVTDDEGRPVHLLTYVRDISERKRLEEERDALLNAERAARGEAERQSQVKDEFLATLSHELRSPLNAILGWTHLLRRGALPPEELREALEVIDSSARSQKQLIEDLLDMSRIVSGKLRLNAGVVELGRILQEAVAAIRPAAQARGIDLELQLGPDLGPVLGDPVRLQQVFWNLLTNAVKFTPPGGRVRVTARVRAQRVVVRVADTGIGIAPEFLPHIFERFRQADASTSRKHRGLGLGLAIVRQLAELHGGSVGALSEGLGRGATFTVELPLFRGSRAAQPHIVGPRPTAPAALLPSAPRLAGRTAIVVDDEPASRDIVTRLLREAELRVMPAGSAAEALAALDAQVPDVLVSDISMPEEDGFSLIRRVRAHADARIASVPAVAVTALARPEDRDRILAAGYQAHVSKPVEPAELLAAIAQVVRPAG